jgi:hypothetical protein
MNQWTPIDKLPPPGIEVLWVYETGEMTLYARDDDDDMRGHYPALTHWMALPDPPEREETSE